MTTITPQDHLHEQHIVEISTADAPIALLLLADPSEQKVRDSLKGSKCFVYEQSGAVIGACVVQPLGFGTYELMSIAVLPEHQKNGIGTALLKSVICTLRQAGVAKLEVGTGTFGYQLAFYQRQGFRVTSIEKDFFINNYKEPVFDSGLQLFDMLRLTLKL
ncbi:GNAT family N-acetyltransferase [Myxococcota bacterium]|nr:GNAT family N-acetyltransferase [Myxococcota bacterium]MBU1380486.1 GNAT family N-acetyltransferase [Myxococcota bacterium]MBU1498294.1 GNAT family N-acetyltransferase [Myxococcota bacterium]